MVNRNLLRQYDLPEDLLRQELEATFDQGTDDWLPPDRQDFQENKIITGRVLRVTSDEVWLDVGYKSEGAVELREWYDEDAGQVVPPRLGEEVPLLLEATEDETGAIVLSYRKAKHRRNGKTSSPSTRTATWSPAPSLARSRAACWSTSASTSFCPPARWTFAGPPTSATTSARPSSAKSCSSMRSRHNIVVSRRQLLEDQRAVLKEKLLGEIQEGQIRMGLVKNIAPFGAFVDLGGIDGLLHITDMDWGRVSDPNEKVHIDQQLEVYVLRVDRQKEKIARL